MLQNNKSLSRFEMAYTVCNLCWPLHANPFIILRLGQIEVLNVINIHIKFGKTSESDFE